jgi:putative ABC transport system permease protein
LVIAEVALSVTLLVGAGLLIHSFIRLNRVDPGFNPDNLVVMDLHVSSAAHPDKGERAEHVRRLEEAIEAVPGVQSVTVAFGLPPSASFSLPVVLQPEGEEPRTAGNPEFLPFAQVRPDFFDVTGARLIAGRAFVPTDTYDSGNVIIDEDLARFLWPSANPTGRRFRIDADRPWLTVVGVMADLKLMGPDDRRGDFEMLHPGSPAMSGSFAIRTRGDGTALLPAIRNAVRQIDANQPIDELETANTRYAEAIDMPRFLLVLISVLAGLALLLAAVGIYGLLAFGVSQRKHELSVRMALGARPSNLTRMIVRNGFLLTAVGAALGLCGALAMSRFIRASLYGVDPVDPVTLVAVTVTVVIVSLIASAVPARRAMAVDPASVLRTE